MHEADIIKYIKSPALLKNAEVSELKKLVDQFPYYQTAHILLLKSLREQNHKDFENQLTESSIYITNRNILYRFLNENFSQDPIPEVEIKEPGLEEAVVEEIVQETPKKLLKDQNVKRKINDSFEGMGENISETLSSQLEFSTVKNEDKLEYPSEIYFVEEERANGSSVKTIDAEPENISETDQNGEVFFIDEEIEKSTDENQLDQEDIELIELDSEEENSEERTVEGGHFNIANYADEKEMSGKDDLISQFIDRNPQLKPADQKDEIIDISEESVREDSELLSETLIKVYIKQGLFEKAIQSYEKLCLKYPEKNAYFASQIEILQEKINKQ